MTVAAESSGNIKSSGYKVMNYSRVNLNKYIVVSIWFGCNNDCSICMLSGMKSHLKPIGFNRYKEEVINIRNEGRFDSLILSGAEVTTCEDLIRYVEFAKSLEWFKKIQIQTNGRKLADKLYVESLIEYGVNEFFISIHGLGDINDKITQAKGSYDETIEGIKNLKDFPVNVITNTVLTKINYHNIPLLMDYLCDTVASELHLWNFYPMEKVDNRDFIVTIRDFVGLVKKILPIFRAVGKPLVLKSFPECLSITEPGFFDSLYPVTILPDRFWQKFDESGFGKCHYRQTGECSNRECWGLSSAHINKYGDERDLLFHIE